MNCKSKWTLSVFNHVVHATEVLAFISFVASIILAFATFADEMWARKIIVATPLNIFLDFIFARYVFYAMISTAIKCGFFSKQYWRKTVPYYTVFFLVSAIIIGWKIDLIAGFIILWVASAHTLFIKRHLNFFCNGKSG